MKESQPWFGWCLGPGFEDFKEYLPLRTLCWVQELRLVNCELVKQMFSLRFEEVEQADAQVQGVLV